MKKSELKQLIIEAINEISEPQKVVGKYIYFVDDHELYSLNPYKLIKNQCDVTLANNWTKTTVMQGEDIRDVLGKQVPDLAAWYIVNSAPSDHVFTAYIGK